ncbi:hypothetical protein [Radiobacillus sp. PE A8.2]|uniref:hypothetical protein n=1 Tax=Radiobacillus sp. PE A8.2 TaxID=3380349 RepID=UPI003890BBB8
MFKKKLLVLLSVLTFVFILAPTVSAAEVDDDCGCHDGVRDVTGAEKNKIVSNLLKSDEWKAMKKDVKALGYKWNGVSGIEVQEQYDQYLVVIPFLTNDRSEVHYLPYMNGQFLAPFPVPVPF